MLSNCSFLKWFLLNVSDPEFEIDYRLHFYGEWVFKVEWNTFNVEQFYLTFYWITSYRRVYAKHMYTLDERSLAKRKSLIHRHAPNR